MTTSTDRVALITGGTRGIGRAIAGRLGGAGLSLVLVYADNTARADAAVRELRETGAEVLAVRADVSDEGAMAAVFDTAEHEFGGTDVVVNAAGSVSMAPLVDLALDDLDTAIRVNLRGTFVVDQQAARRVRAGGAIINLSSSITRFGLPGNTAYAATKAAVESMTLTLARELRGRDITVNAIAPGPTATDMLMTAMAGDDSLRDSLAAQSPLERLATPDDIAEIAEFLAGPGRWINGQVIFANGGAI